MIQQRGSEAIFRRTSDTPSHLPGLSLLFLPAYSSLHCLMKLEILYHSFPFSVKRDFISFDNSSKVGYYLFSQLTN